jgi:hypothetical protein
VHGDSGTAGDEATLPNFYELDVYGGLAKVGMDNTLGPDGQEEKEEMAPGFSTSAMRYVKDLIKTHRSDDEEEEEDNI